MASKFVVNEQEMRKDYVTYKAHARAKFPLTLMGVLAHSLRTLDRSLIPPSTHTEICLQSHL